MGTDSGGQSFSRALAALKRQGCTLLVVGEASEQAHLAVSRRLLGDPATETRRRVLVLTDGPPAADRLPADERSGDLLTVLRAGSPTRSATGPAPGPATAGVPARSVAPDDLDGVTDAVETAIDEFASMSNGLAPAELRVCVDSLTPLVERNDRDRVEAFLDDLARAVGRVRGMAHCHLPVPRVEARDAGLVERFDAIVEVRTVAGRPQHRWYVRDPGVETDWLPV